MVVFCRGSILRWLRCILLHCHKLLESGPIGYRKTSVESYTANDFRRCCWCHCQGLFYTTSLEVQLQKLVAHRVLVFDGHCTTWHGNRLHCKMFRIAFLLARCCREVFGKYFLGHGSRHGHEHSCRIVLLPSENALKPSNCGLHDCYVNNIRSEYRSSYQHYQPVDSYSVQHHA